MSIERNTPVRYIALLRCSTPGQIETSIQQQRRIVDQYASAQGWQKVDEVALEGITGSRPGARTDVEELVARKLTRDDFDAVVVQDTSRLTRAGTDEMHHIIRTFASVGIETRISDGQIPDDEEGEVYVSLRGYTDKKQVRALAFTATRGSMAALAEGRTAHSRRIPFGIDCLYTDAAGQARQVVRTLTDGTQEVRDPQTGAVLMVLPRNQPFRKQKAQKVTYIPGETARVEVVRRMYHMHYIEGIGTFTIARQLNTDGIPSPSGAHWTQSSVHQLLRNTVYTGFAYANRRSNAVYNMRDRTVPLRSKATRRELLSRKRPATRYRPESDWVRIDYPQLADYLPEDVRAVAVARQREHLDRHRGERAAHPRRNPSSDYFLTGILRSAQTGAALSGCPKGAGSCRYYRDSRAVQAPVADPNTRRLVRAEPVERAVLEVIQLVLRFVPYLKREVEQQVREVVRAEDADRRQLDDLRRQRGILKRQVELAIAHADPDQPGLFADAVAHLKQQHRQLSDRIASVEEKVGAGSADIDALVAQTLSGLSKLSDVFDAVSPASLTEVVRVLVPRLEVDLATKDVTVEVALPACCDPTLLMGLASISSCRSGHQTHRPGPGFRFIFTLIWNNRSKTYERRVRVDWDWVETDWEKEVEAG